MKHPIIAGVTLLLVLAAGAAGAQGIGINGTGAQADASAMLDVAATNKGLLLPRMTAAQRAAIVSPATGLVVYQTDAPAGLYYNAGTPASPSWQMAGGAGAAGQWSTSGADLYYSAGKVAVGTTPTGYALTLMDALNGLRVQTNTFGNASSRVASFGGAGRFDVDANGVAGGRFTIIENGSTGIGLASPTNPLSFAGVLGKKISLFHDATGGDYGFGIANARVQIYGGYPGADVAIGYDNVGTFVEKLAIKPNGSLAVSGNVGSPGQVLQSNGAGAAASWVNPTANRYNNLYQAVCTAAVMVGATSGVVAVPGLSQSFTVSGPARVIVHFSVPMHSLYCFACGQSLLNLFTFLDGGYAASFAGAQGQYVDNANLVTMSGTVMLDVGAGTHTVDMRATNLSGPDASVGYVWLNSCTLVLEVVPQ